MKTRTLILSFLFILFITPFVSSLLAMNNSFQETQAKALAPKYRSFLAATHSIMTSAERDIFQNLKNNRERDLFIEAFWKSRGGRQQGVRANVNLLMLMQMVQVLDLREDQVVKIMPVLNKNEKEKQDLQRQIAGHLGELRILTKEDPPETAEDKEDYHSRLLGKLDVLRELRSDLRVKEMEFDTFLKANLTPLQQAKYVLFSQDFYRGLRERLDDARRTQQRLRQPIRKKRGAE